jgi:hypothetical protein
MILNIEKRWKNSEIESWAYNIGCKDAFRVQMRLCELIFDNVSGLLEYRCHIIKLN